MTSGAEDRHTEDGDGDIDYYRVIYVFARERFNALARKVIFRLQRRRRVGLFDDYRLKTVWDEYCWHCQHGSNDDDIAFGLDRFLAEWSEDVVGQLSNAEATLLSCVASEAQGAAARADHDLIREIEDYVRRAAMRRDMERFES